jgi:hypothetical protein
MKKKLRWYRHLRLWFWYWIKANEEAAAFKEKNPHYDHFGNHGTW